MRAVFASLCYGLLCVVPAHAGTIRADVDPQAYLDLGASPVFASVGRLSTTRSAGSLTASGTLIAPDVVLTAAHTLDGASALSFLVGGQTYTATQWTPYPLWNGNLEAGYDLGLIKLSSPVTNVAPATRYSGNSEKGMTVTQVGYGMTGTGLTGATRYDGKKRAGTNRIDSLTAGSGSNARLLWMDFDQPGSLSLSRTSDKNGPTALEYLIARGDSGGGLFADTRTGMQLIGISSFGYSLDGNADASYGEKAAFTRVSAFDDWIDAMLRQFSPTTTLSGRWAGRPGTRANEFLIDVPEPSSVWLALSGLVALLFRRRRRR